MAQKDQPADQAQPNWITRLLNTVEWLGNLLPHPVTLFALLALAILLVSGVLGWMGVSVPDPRPEGTDGRAVDGMIRVISVLDPEGLRRIVTNLVTNFTGFVSLGTVLVAMLGVGIAERSGLLTAAIKLLVLGAPRNLMTVVVVFAAVMSSTASEMGYVVVNPLELIQPGYEVHAAVNWYFMMASTFVVTRLGWFVTAKVVEPKLGAYDRPSWTRPPNQSAWAR